MLDQIQPYYGEISLVVVVLVSGILAKTRFGQKILGIEFFRKLYISKVVKKAEEKIEEIKKEEQKQEEPKA